MVQGVDESVTGRLGGKSVAKNNRRSLTSFGMTVAIFDKDFLDMVLDAVVIVVG
jgi:hypothetical protein